MSNQGFKGVVVQIQEVTIKAGPAGLPILDAAIQFASEEGVVHAITRHALQLDPTEDPLGLSAAARELFLGLTRYIEAMHFDSPLSASRPATIKGILESLRPDSDEPGTQG